MQATFDAYVTAVSFDSSGQAAFALGDGGVRFENGQSVPAPDLTLSLRSDPPTSATLCGGSLPHGFVPAPRQWGLEAVRRWRF